MTTTDETPVPSPCINVCQLNDTGTHCIGCQRSVDEIANWSQYSNAQKRIVLERIAAGSPTPLVRDKTCQQCGKTFGCGTGGRNGGCWCSDFPNVLPFGLSSQDCLCPDCMRNRLLYEYAKRGLPAPF